MKRTGVETTRPNREIGSANHELHEQRMLELLQNAERVTQRGLSRELGIALGLTNLLIRRLVKKGWVRVSKVSPSRIMYFITPTGIAEKTKLSRAYFQGSVQFYRETRDRIRDRFGVLSARRPSGTVDGVSGRIVFYGAGEVAEIGFVCLADTNLHLVGVVDPERTKPFFHLAVHPPEAIRGLALNGEKFDWLVVMSFGDLGKLHGEILGLDVPADRVFWL